MRLQKLINSLPEPQRALIQGDVLLRDLTSLRIGGPATVVCPIGNAEDARRFQALSREADVPLFILGGGSNVLAADAGFQGVVLHVAAGEIRRRGDVIRVGAGYGFDNLIAQTLAWGLTGLEFASGIPGTVGGALVGNAGCYGHEIGEFLLDATVLRPDGTVETVGPEAFGFRYRATDLRETGNVVLEATLRLSKGDVGGALASRAEKIADRRRKHPVDTPCAGSWFRNLPPAAPGERRQAAGRLLELAGALDFREGDAHVFGKHANMIINTGNATSEDVLRLADRMEKAVLDKFGVNLIPEVRYLSDATA